MVAEVVARIRERQRRVAENHPTLAQEGRERLVMGLSIAEAAALADALEERRRGGVILGRLIVRNTRPGKVSIVRYGDGEGGEFAEAGLAEVVEGFFAREF